jgi:hypothetical protein
MPLPALGASYSTTVVLKPAQDSIPFMNNGCSGIDLMTSTTLRSSRRKSPTFDSMGTCEIRLRRK